jgi:hypothetical protein
LATNNLGIEAKRDAIYEPEGRIQGCEVWRRGQENKHGRNSPHLHLTLHSNLTNSTPIHNHFVVFLHIAILCSKRFVLGRVGGGASLILACLTDRRQEYRDLIVGTLILRTIWIRHRRDGVAGTAGGRDGDWIIGMGLFLME